MADEDKEDAYLSPPIPEDLTKTLTAAAEQIGTLRNLLPENQITRSDVSTVHLISDADLVRLRFAGRMGLLTNSVQMWIGAAIGLAIPAAGAVVTWISRRELTALSSIELLTLVGFGICAGVSFSLHRIARGRTETVDKLCDQIEGRPRARTE